MAGTLATLGGADAAAMQAAQDMGAQFGARRYSKDFELEADALGTEIAWRAGFDPMRGRAVLRAASPIRATSSWAPTRRTRSAWPWCARPCATLR